jgi:hypothetical protein
MTLMISGATGDVFAREPLVNVEGHEAVLVFVGVEERELLMPVGMVGRRVHIQNDHFRRRVIRGDERVDEGIAQAQEVSGGHGIFKACHGWLRAQVRIIGRIAAHGGLQRRVRAQVIAVVGILVAAADLIGALAHQFGDLVCYVARAAVVGDDLGQSIHQAELAVNLPEQQYTAVGADARFVEQRRDFLAFEGCEFELGYGRVIHA